MESLPQLSQPAEARIELAKLEAAKTLRDSIQAIRTSDLRKIDEDLHFQIPLCMLYADFVKPVVFTLLAELANEGHDALRLINLASQKITVETLKSWSDSGGDPKYKDYFVETTFKKIKASPEYEVLIRAAAGRIEDGQRASIDTALTTESVASSSELVGYVDPINVSETTSDRERTFRQEGGLWSLTFDERTVRLKHTKGLGYIAQLLRSPGRPFDCLQLLAASIGERRLPRLGSGTEILDAVAVKSYQSRYEDLADRLDEAERNHDQGQKEALQAEMDQLTCELGRASGLRGRHRKQDNDGERVRKSVSNAITRGIDLIREHHPALANHLKSHIQPGSSVTYSGDGISWRF